MKVQGSRKSFATPIEVGTVTTKVGDNPSRSVDEQTDVYLSDRRKRKLDEAKQAELGRVTEEEKTEAARLRKERELITGDKVSPRGNMEEDMETTNEKVANAAEVAAEAASAGVNPESAKDLGTGKSKVVIIKPEASEGVKEGGGWSVVDGRPVKDPEGEYTFNQAHKVAALEAAKHSEDPMALFKFLKEEGFLGDKKDDFLSTFMTELARKSVDNLVHPPSGNSFSGSSEATTLREELKELRAEIQRSSDPVEAARRVKVMFDTFRSIGLLHEEAEGKNLEVTKEEHHHDEKMEEIKADREYKQELTRIASDIPERIGHGIAGQFAEEGGGSEGGGLETLECSDCHFKIPITPETGESVTCPKCEAVYLRKKETVESKQKEK